MTPDNQANSIKKSSKSVRNGRKYQYERLKGPYDAIVIGSGIGGLTAATSLSEMGKKVLVLEQHYTAGGFTHAYARKGYEWDVGVHYIGDVGYPTMGRKLFDFISDGNLKWAAMDKIYDRIFLGDDTYNLVAGKAAFAEQIKQYFPDEHDAVDQYLKMVAKVNKGMRLFTLSKILGPWQQKLFSKLIKVLLPDYFNKTTYDVLRTITDNEKLIAVLTGQWGDNGMPPKKCSFMIHCLIVKHYLNGGFYPVGGASKIAETIIPKIKKSGGEVFTHANVEQILINNGRASGVKLANGDELFAPLIISNVGVFNTYGKLVPQSVSKQFSYDTNLSKVKRSMTNVGLFIGLKQDAKTLGLPKTNFWIYLDENHDNNVEAFVKDHTNPMPVIYISFPSAKDPSFETRYPGRSTIEIVAPASYEIFEQWKETSWRDRGDDYEDFREYFAQRMLKVLYKKLPQLEGKIDYYEASTPLTTKFFSSYEQGEIYGLDHDPSRFNQDWLRPRSRIPGLWLTGQDVLSCGVVGAMMAGFLTAFQILGIRDGYKLSKRVFSNTKTPAEGWFIPSD